MMGPNAMRISEELASFLDIRPGMRVLDLGCGCGLSTLLLAEKYGATVFAADLWISPTENYQRFRSLGIDDKAIRFMDATKGCLSHTAILTCCFRGRVPLFRRQRGDAAVAGSVVNGGYRRGRSGLKVRVRERRSRRNAAVLERRDGKDPALAGLVERPVGGHKGY